MSRVLTLSITLLFTGAACAELSDAQTEAIRGMVASVIAEEGIPGISVGIVQNGDSIWAEGFGEADIDSGAPATADTVYRIASISKMITATVVLRLDELGVLQLEEPIHTYTDAFPEKPWPITVQHLLCHQSGIRHWKTRDEQKNTRRYSGIASSLESFKDEPLLFEPGTKDEYSTPGYNVLGVAIEGATGMRFDGALEELVLKPAGTRTLRPDYLQPRSTPRAGRYRVGREGAVPSPPHDVSIKVPGGGLSGSATDLAKFALALLTGKLVSEASLNAMWTEKLVSSGEPTRKGYGCNLGEEKGRFVVWHIGGLVGASSILYIYPDRKHAVAVLTNRRAAPVFQMASEIMDVIVQRAAPTAVE